jgi:prepilin-type N-terminal cleavage/methylation domain-containing protein
MKTRTHGFTLMEMVVVMAIIIILMGMGIPGLVNAQRRADRYSTINILGTVHDACVSNARQFGSSGVVYGFTLAYTSSVIAGQSSAIAATPWAIMPNGTTLINNSSATAGVTVANSFQAMIGKEMVWNGANIDFVDVFVPSTKITVDGVSSTITSNSISIAYEPRSGFPHYQASAPTAALNAATISAAGSTPNKIELAIWHKSRKQQMYTFVIHQTGASDVRTGP